MKEKDGAGILKIVLIREPSQDCSSTEFQILVRTNNRIYDRYSEFAIITILQRVKHNK